MNMSAIGVALEVPNESFLLLNIADTIVCGIWLFILFGFGKRIFARILPAYGSDGHARSTTEFDERMHKKSLIGLLLSAAVLAAAAGISQLLIHQISEMIVILSITTIALILSRVRSVNTLKGSYGLGNYLLLVFCVIIGTLADFQKIITTGPQILTFVIAIVIMVLMLHVFIARMLRVDVDSFLVASTAGLFGPAFIAPVANAIRQPSLIPLGIAASILGFAIGNYAGLGLYLLLTSF